MKVPRARIRPAEVPFLFCQAFASLLACRRSLQMLGKKKNYTLPVIWFLMIITQPKPDNNEYIGRSGIPIRLLAIILKSFCITVSKSQRRYIRLKVTPLRSSRQNIACRRSLQMLGTNIYVAPKKIYGGS